MSDEKTRAEGYAATSPRSKRKPLRRLPQSHGPEVSKLDSKLRTKRAARRGRRLKKGKARRPLGRRSTPTKPTAPAKSRSQGRRRQKSLETRRLRPPSPLTRPPREPDPSFDSARLKLELVPRPLWYTSNIRTILPKEDWDLLRRAVYRRANYLCEMCGGRGPDHPIECHEVWHYDEGARTQALERMTGLCPSCHGVKHMGRSRIVGKGNEAIAHLAAVNGWPLDLAEKYVDFAFYVWARRSGLPGWRLLVDWDAIANEYKVRLSLTGKAEYLAGAAEPRSRVSQGGTSPTPTAVP